MIPHKAASTKAIPSSMKGTPSKNRWTNTSRRIGHQSNALLLRDLALFQAPKPQACGEACAEDWIRPQNAWPPPAFPIQAGQAGGGGGAFGVLLVSQGGGVGGGQSWGSEPLGRGCPLNSGNKNTQMPSGFPWERKVILVWLRLR